MKEKISMTMTSHSRKPSTILKQADHLLNLRGREYGSYIDLFDRMSARFTQSHGEKHTPYQCAMLMVELKLARLDLNKYDEDSLVDAINYLALAGALATDKAEKTVGDIDLKDLLNKPPQK